MVGKNNHEVLNKKTGRQVNRYGFRRLSVGVASVAVAGLLFASNTALVQAAEGSDKLKVEATAAKSEESTETDASEVPINEVAETVEEDRGLEEQTEEDNDTPESNLDKSDE